MPIEGMVDALRRARDLARPNGCIVDLHPTAVRATVYVNLTAAGSVDAGDAPERHQAASDAIETAIAERFFTVVRAFEFDYHVYAESLDELQEHIVEDWRDARISDETMTRARRLLAESPQSRVSVHERVRITLLRPDAGPWRSS